MKNKVLIAFVLFGLFASPCFAGAENEGLNKGRAADQSNSDKLVLKPLNSPKVSSAVKEVRDQMLKEGVTSQNARSYNPKRFSNQLVHVDDNGYIQVYIYLEAVDNKNLNELKSYKIIVENVKEDLKIVQAQIPFSLLEVIADLPFVKKITNPDYGMVRVGDYTTEGSSILLTNKLNELGFNGAGVRVGVISDGANDMDYAISTLDLPEGISVFGSCVPQGGVTCNEGTAMLEIIHDLAPEASLAIGSASTSLEFMDRLTDLVDTFGATIVVDDIGFYNEPFFEDGPVATAVKTLVDRGILYVSAAGNDAERHYQANFLGMLSYDPVLPNHGFGDGVNPDMNVILGGGENITVILQWNDPFGLSANNYELYLVDDSEKYLLAGSTDIQDGDDNPIEAMTFTNPLTDPIRVKIVILKRSGTDQLLEMFMFGGYPEEYITPEDSIFGHPSVPGVVSVAAIDASDVDHDTIEPFSSRGPVTLFYPDQQERQKPDVTGIDGVYVTGAGGFWTPFFGTSAAAPHIAGVAALLSGMYDLTAQELITVMQNSAVNLGDVNTFGAGRVDAYAAARLLDKAPTATIDMPASDVSITRGDSVEFAGTCVDEDGTKNTYLWQFGAGSGISDNHNEDPGNVMFYSVGVFKVQFSCADVLGVSSSSDVVRTVTVVNAAPSGSSSDVEDHGSGGSGGCSLIPDRAD